MSHDTARLVKEVFIMKYHDITPEMTIGDLVKSKVYGDFGTHIFTDMTPDHWNAPLAS